MPLPRAHFDRPWCLTMTMTAHPTSLQPVTVMRCCYAAVLTEVCRLRGECCRRPPDLLPAIPLMWMTMATSICSRLLTADCLCYGTTGVLRITGSAPESEEKLWTAAV